MFYCIGYCLVLYCLYHIVLDYTNWYCIGSYHIGYCLVLYWLISYLILFGIVLVRIVLY